MEEMKPIKIESILFPQPTIGAYCDGVPVLSYGYTHVLGGSPDLVEEARIQAGNDAPLRKVPLPTSFFQPQAAYYVMRNLSTALDGLRPDDEFSIRVEGIQEAVEVCGLSRPGEKVVALWLKGRAADECAGLPARITVEGSFESVSGYDCMNGVTQELQSSLTNGETVIDGLLVKDYPILLRLSVCVTLFYR